MRFEVLGPLRVEAGSVVISARQQRVLLAMLLLHAGEVVPFERLIEAVWADRSPRDTAGQLQSAVYRLRKQLAAAGGDAGLITTEPGGYRLRADSHDLDLSQFRQLRDAARAAGGSEQAAHRYRDGLRLWRGPALADIDSPDVHRAAAALDEEHLQARQEWIEVELALGGAGELIAELTGLVHQHPYREGLHAALMRALYQAGRQADALAAYRQLRQLLRDELGTEPAPELHQLHQAILNRDPQLTAPTLAPAPSPPVTPRELPADVAGFTGRDTALKTLDGILQGLTGPVVITAIAGTAGVGKTALAVHWAHRAADRFPEGQLYVNLRGYATDAPVRPIEALAAMLRSLGVATEQIPADEAQAAGMYRTQLADRRVLVVLDNAGTVGQVRPLLPGSPGCLVLVTSRDRLAGLVARDGAHRLTLDVLTPDEAHTLLTRLIGVGRVATEPAAAASLTQKCAYLPLALRIAAAHLADHPGLSITGYVSELATNELEALRIDGDDESAVRAAFDLSYQTLPANVARLFRLLGLVPGPSVTPPAAAALADTGVTEARHLLRELADAHLIEEQSVDRFTFHDLIRRYAHNLTEHDDNPTACNSALTRLFDWYLHTADIAATTLHPTELRLPLPASECRAPDISFTGPTQAMAWYDAERTNLVAAIRDATSLGSPAIAYLLADRLRNYLWMSGHMTEWSTVTEAALAAAQKTNNHQAAVTSHLSLSDFYMRLANYSEAGEHLRTARKLARRTGWTEAEGGIVLGLAEQYWYTGDLGSATRLLRRGLALARETGQQGIEGNALINLTGAYLELGHLSDAADSGIRALGLFRQLRNDRGTAMALNNLGDVYHELGRITDAIDHLTEALRRYRKLGHRYGEVHASKSLAAVQRDAGSLADALRTARLALRIAREIDARHAEPDLLTTLGSVYLLLGHTADALHHHQTAVDLAQETGARHPVIIALLGRAGVLHRLGHRNAADEDAQRALALASESGYRVREGHAWTLLTQFHLDQDRIDEALECANRALDNHQKTGHRLGEACALTVLGLALHRTGNPQARRHQEAARKLFNQIGAPVPDELSAMGESGPGRR